jgi:hypothetical protein
MPPRKTDLSAQELERIREEFERIQEQSERFVREQLIGDSQLEGYGDVVRSILLRIQSSLVETTEDIIEDTSKRIGLRATKLFADITEIFAESMSDALYRSAKSLGGEGALFGQAGRDLGRSLGESFGSSVDQRFSRGSLSRELRVFERVGGLFGDVFVQYAQMEIEGFRMVGARLAPMMTAGFLEGNEDYKELGKAVTAIALEIRLGTGATVEEIARLGSEISRLGVPFRDGGSAAAQYALALANVKNVQVDTSYAMYEAAVRTHGQDLEAVGRAMEMFTAASSSYRMEADKGNDSMSRALSSTQNLLEMYGQVRGQLGSTSAEMVALSSAFLAFVGVSKEMGGRTAMITEQVGGLMRSLFQAQQTGLSDILLRGDFLTRLMKMTPQGREVINRAEPIATKLGVDLEQQLPIVLEYLFAQTGGVGEDAQQLFTLAMTEAAYKSSTAGGPYGGVRSTTDSFNATMFAFSKVLGMGVRPFYLARESGRRVQELREGGMSYPDIFRDLAAEGTLGLNPQEVIGQSKELTESQLSFQQEFEASLQLAATKDIDLHALNIAINEETIPRMNSYTKAMQRRTRDVSELMSSDQNVWRASQLSAANRDLNRRLLAGPIGRLFGLSPSKKSVVVGSSTRQVDGGVQQEVMSVALPEG